MQSFLNQLIYKKRRRFLDDYNEMVGDYNREFKTARDYNGRQILELLQNCDDQNATEVFIEVNEEERSISISNNGEPFSLTSMNTAMIKTPPKCS